MAKVIFLHLFVMLFTGGGGCASMHAGIPTPPNQADPPGSDINPPGPGRPPRTRQTPQTRQTPRTRQTPSRPGRPPPGPGRPPRIRHPPPGSRLQHTVYERPVRILLECILVVFFFSKKRRNVKKWSKMGIRMLKGRFQISKVTLPVFRVCCGTLNSNQSKECKRLMEFPLIHFNILKKAFRDMSDGLKFSLCSPTKFQEARPSLVKISSTQQLMFCNEIKHKKLTHFRPNNLNPSQTYLWELISQMSAYGEMANTIHEN